MTRTNQPRIVVVSGLAAFLTLAGDPVANAQSAGFQPQVSQAFSGALVDVIPVVSADRRYVRLNVNASFSQLNGFTTYSVPIVAGGFSGGTGGTAGLVGMNGLMGQGAGGMESALSLGQNGQPLAGPIASGAEFETEGQPDFQAAARSNMMDWPRISPTDPQIVPRERARLPLASAGAAKNRKARLHAKATQSLNSTIRKPSRQPGR